MPTSHIRRTLMRWLFGLTVLALIPGAPAVAQIIVDPPPLPPPPRVQPVRQLPQVTVSRHQVDAVVDGPVAAVHVTQEFRNDSTQSAEGVYLFPLPKDAAVGDFQITVDGQVLEGRLLTREEARSIYEEIVRRQLDPALLEYVDRDLFQASVFPIPPGETRKVELNYTHVLPREDGLYRFHYPMRTRRYSTAPVEQLSINVELVDQAGLRTVYSPNYPIRLERLADEATVRFTAERLQPEQDFDLYFGADDAAIGLNVLSYKPAGEDGYFVMLAAPGVATQAEEIVARDVVLVVDVSGSMQGEKMEQAQAAAQYVVEQLNPEDRFNLIAFSTGAQLWQRTLQPVDDAAAAEAAGWIEGLRATGSTDINRALLEALAQLDRAGDAVRPAYILFLTDGQPTQGETEPAAILANVRNNEPAGRTIRLFPFGLGYDVNTDLLDVLSQELGGRDSYVAPGERIDEAVSSFYAQISTPVLTDVAIDAGDALHMDEIYPFPLPDLFAGEQLVVVGRYREGAVVGVELTGDVNGAMRLFVYPDRRFVEDGGEPFVARLWATRKIGMLLDQVRRDGSTDEVIDAIVDLSLRYGIVTPYTSYLVEEPAVVTLRDGAAFAPAAPAAMDDMAQMRVAEAAAAAASEASSGEAAVKASVLREQLQQATTVSEAPEAVRHVSGRTFKRQATQAGPHGEPLELWVDTLYDESMTVTTVRFGSDEYFDLLEDPAIAPWLAIASELVMVTGEGEALRVTAAD